MKLSKQIFLVVFEVTVITYLLTNLSLLISPVDSSWGFVERFVFCYGIYQFCTFLILSNRNDSRRDMYLAILTNFRYAELYLTNFDPILLRTIHRNITYQNGKRTFNDKDITRAYEDLKNSIESSDLRYIQSSIILYEHLYELESLSWRFNFILRIFK